MKIILEQARFTYGCPQRKIFTSFSMSNQWMSILLKKEVTPLISQYAIIESIGNPGKPQDVQGYNNIEKIKNWIFLRIISYSTTKLSLCIKAHQRIKMETTTC